ncbi:GGDEF domain-containing protein [Gorillibacterium timonense]|uniref:GGDEF domain-containing protein n=1 Tax=Gorillibacterium timonense TaxID=1689269 RepID=UPI0009E8CCAB|nr:GGDEF domain-containing protein [Gorillibacterium timonense]
MKIIRKTVLPVLVPILFLALSYLLFLKTNSMSDPQVELIKASPYAILLVGCIISWKFNHSREFFVLFTLGWSMIYIAYLPSVANRFGVQETAVLFLLSLAIPVTIAIFSFLGERGISSFWGILRFVFIAAEFLAILWLSRVGHTEWLLRWNRDLLPVKPDSFTSLSQVALLAFAVTLIMLVFRHRTVKSSQDISFLAVLVAVFFVLRTGGSDPVLAAIGIGVSGIILITSIIQDSYSMAFTDELTGLPSRRALKQDMMKLGFSYTIAMLDIDFFKKFNDTHGHDTGDDVLKLVASIIKEVSGGGKAYRYGGEEFTILFRNKTCSEAIPHLEELRETVSKRGFILRGKDRPKKKPEKRSSSSKPAKEIFITVSIGVSQKNETSKTPDDVMKAADKALYRAKKKGRNRVSK